MNFIEKYFRRWKRDKYIRLLTHSDPELIVAYGQDRVLPAFRKAAAQMPAYRKILEAQGVEPQQINSLSDFQNQVPVIAKEDLFPVYQLQELVAEGQFDQLASVLVSSGFSGHPSFGIVSKREETQATFLIDIILDYLFQTSRKKTFLLNCLPMGVKIPTCLPHSETSVRTDLALSVIKKIQPSTEQFLIIGGPHFLKKLAEDGIQQGLNWPALNVNFILGSDWFSESYRSYMAQLLGIDFNHPDKGYLGANFGITELGLSLFHETIETIRLRRELQRNQQLNSQLFGRTISVIPELLVYYPNRYFLESLENQDLIFSMLDPDSLIPLIRYNSGDTGDLYPHNRLKDILSKENHEDLLPELKLPVVALKGRSGKVLSIEGKTVAPEEIKQGLYSDYEVAALTTGYFRMSENKNIGQVEIQLKKNIIITPELRQKFRKALLKYTQADMEIVIYHYQDFPYNMALNYENKFLAI